MKKPSYKYNYNIATNSIDVISCNLKLWSVGYAYHKYNSFLYKIKLYYAY